eukprot:1294660-Rhodomonas_salina.1
MVWTVPPIVSANRVADASMPSAGQRRVGRHARPTLNATRTIAAMGPVAILRMVRPVPPIVSANRVTDAWTASVGRRKTERHARPTTNVTRATDAVEGKCGLKENGAACASDNDCDSGTCCAGTRDLWQTRSCKW